MPSTFPADGYERITPPASLPNIQLAPRSPLQYHTQFMHSTLIDFTPWPGLIAPSSRSLHFFEPYRIVIVRPRVRTLSTLAGSAIRPTTAITAETAVSHLQRAMAYTNYVGPLRPYWTFIPNVVDSSGSVFTFGSSLDRLASSSPGGAIRLFCVISGSGNRPPGRHRLCIHRKSHPFDHWRQRHSHLRYATSSRCMSIPLPIRLESHGP